MTLMIMVLLKIPMMILIILSVLYLKVEDFKNMGDVLAQSKNLGQNSALRPKDLVYGKPSC